MKTCSTCKLALDLFCFSKNRANKDGLQHRCKCCVKKHYTKNREEVLAKCKEYSLSHKDEKRKYDLNRRIEKGDSIREYDRKRNKSQKRRKKSLDWQKNNPDKRRLIASRSAKKHWEKTYETYKSKFIANASNRRAVKNKALFITDYELHKFVFEEAVDLCSLREKKYGFKWEIDHIVPIKGKTVCGLHSYNNIQVIPRYVNRWKRNRLLESTYPHFERKV